jgi:hypothetical protein
MGKQSSLNPSGWTEHPESIAAYHAAGERWMAARAKKRLASLGSRLWEVAAARGTVTYSNLAGEFAVGRRGKYGVGMWAGLVSEYCRSVMGHVFLSCVIVNAGTQTRAHPMGVPAPGGWWDGLPETQPERTLWALDRQKVVWDYCSSHPDPFLI